MFYALSWILVFSLFALWSLGAWAFHAAAVWALSQANGVSGAALGDHAMTLPGWLEPWVPTEVLRWAGEMLVAVGPVVDDLVRWAPALAGGLTTVTWVVWGVGSAFLLLTGLGLHALIALARRSARAGAAPNGTGGAPLAAG